jgi:ketosteroid isomerase-like protein
MTKTEAEIGAVVAERIDAIRSKDAKRAVDLLSDDVVAFELAPPLAALPEAARDLQAFGVWLDGFDNIDIKVREMHIEADEVVGFARALHHLVGTRRDGRPISLWLRSTLCFRREGSAWKIAHAHSSVPMYMDGSFRAAIDLQP